MVWRVRRDPQDIEEEKKVLKKADAPMFTEAKLTGGFVKREASLPLAYDNKSWKVVKCPMDWNTQKTDDN